MTDKPQIKAVLALSGDEFCFGSDSGFRQDTGKMTDYLFDKVISGVF
jgi:hypothetical protein